MPDLPPSDDFAAYLGSPYHQHRVARAKQTSLLRLRNYADSDVYSAISESLGMIAALAEFYAPVAPTLTQRIAGDPAPGRVVQRSTDLGNGKKLQPLQRRMVQLLADGRPRDPGELLAAVGSAAREAKVVGAAMRNLRHALSGTGIVLEDDALGRIVMPAASCAVAKSILGVA